MTDKEKLEKILSIFIWEGHDVNNDDEFISFVDEYVSNSENNESILKDIEELFDINRNNIYDIVSLLKNIVNGKVTITEMDGYDD